MGQVFGRAKPPVVGSLFINLPRSYIYRLWEAFNDISEGYGLSIHHFYDIIKAALLPYLGITEKTLYAEVDALFRVFDDDENHLIDSFECISSLAILSGMTIEEKCRYLFAIFDLEESDNLSLNAILVAFRSALTGLSKLCDIDIPSETDLLKIVLKGLSKNLNTSNAESNETKDDIRQVKKLCDSVRIDKETFLSFCMHTPEILSWLEYFDDVEECNMIFHRQYIDQTNPQDISRERYCDMNKYVKSGTYLANYLGEDQQCISHIRLQYPFIPTMLERLMYTATTPSISKSPYNIFEELKINESLSDKAPKTTVSLITSAESDARKLSKSNLPRLEMDWIYGYNGHSRRNIFYNERGEVIYPAGTVVVIQNVQNHLQSYFVQHSNIILSLTTFKTSKDETIVASGEYGKHPLIHVWDCSTRTIISTLKGFHTNGVSCLDFSPDRSKLVSLGMDQYHSIAVYQWRTNRLLHTTQLSTLPILDVKYVTDLVFVTCGADRFVYFFKERKDRQSYQPYRGILPPSMSSQGKSKESFNCIGYICENLVIGSSTGQLNVLEGRNLIRSIAAHHGPIQTICCVDQGINSALMTACAHGDIIIWNRKLEKAAVFPMISVLSRLFPHIRYHSSQDDQKTADGSKSHASRAISDNYSEMPCHSIVALNWNLVTSTIVVGFSNNMIIEINSMDGKCYHDPIVLTHSKPRISGLATHPFKPQQICTVGDDNCVRIYDITARKPLRYKYIGATGNCCAYSPDAKYILICIGSSSITKESWNSYDDFYSDKAITKKEGVHMILDADSLSVVYEGQDTNKAIHDCKFSCNGETYTLASADSCIYIYTTKNFKRVAICRGHNAAVLHIDISLDNEYMMSNDASGQILYWRTMKGEVISARNTSEITWTSNSCVNSTATQNIGPIIPSLRYHTSSMSHSRRYIAVGTNIGELRLFESPCDANNAQYLACYGHGMNISQCAFTCDDSFVLSTGENDGCIIQWRLSTASDDVSHDELASTDPTQGSEVVGPSNDSMVVSKRQSIEAADFNYNHNYFFEMKFESSMIDEMIKHSNRINDLPISLFEYEEAKFIDNNMKRIEMPWHKSIVAPTHVPLEDLSEPPDLLVISYIYGITVDRCRSSLEYLPMGDIVYFVAAVAVIMEPARRTQRYYLGHKSTITAMAVLSHVKIKAKDKERDTETYPHGVVATGDVSECPSIRIWDPMNLKTISVLKGYHSKAILHLSFSKDGSKLVSLGQDAFHSIAVYDWQNGNIIHSYQGFINKSLFITFSPCGSKLLHGGYDILRVYELNGLNVTWEDVAIENKDKVPSAPMNEGYKSHYGLIERMSEDVQETIHTDSSLVLDSIYSGEGYSCGVWLDDRIAFIGTIHGFICRIAVTKSDGTTQAHYGSINAIVKTSKGICTTGSDGLIKFWSLKPDFSIQIQLEVNITTFRCYGISVQCLSYLEPADSLVFATNNAEVFEISCSTGCNIHTNESTDHHDVSIVRSHNGALIEGHGGDELWGLSCNPTKDEYCTIGDDAVLRFWDVSSCVCTNALMLEMPARSCCYSPDGKFVVVGFGSPRKIKPKQYDGKWSILEISTGLITHEARDSKSWITEIKFSPNGEFLAMASFDNKIYVYNTFNAYALSAVISHHDSYTTAFDFSEDSAWLQANTVSKELSFFETDTGINIPAPARLRDTAWATQNCYMSWAVKGIWLPYDETIDILACDSNMSARNRDHSSDSTQFVENREKEIPIIITGDNCGDIHLYRYPCTNSLSHSKRYSVSSSPITRIKMFGGHNASKSSHVVTVVGQDKAIILWKHVKDTGKKVASNILARRGMIEEDEEDVIEYFDKFKQDKSMIKKSLALSKALDVDISTHNDQDVPETSKLKMDLQLVHILGYQSDLSRSSVFYLSSQGGNKADIAYPLSRYVVSLNIGTNMQQIYHHHKEEVSCVTLSHDRQLLASGVKSFRPQITICNSLTGKHIRTLPPFHRGGIIMMQFSSDRRLLVSLGQDVDHSIALWESPNGNWDDSALRATSKGHIDPVLFCSFLTLSAGCEYILATGGRFHIKFWRLHGKCLNSEYAEVSESVKLGTQLCGREVFVGSIVNCFLSGSTNGHLYIWKGRKFESVIKAHDSGITRMYVSSTGSVLTGSKDGMLKVWKPSLDGLDLLRVFDISKAKIAPLSNAIRSIDVLVSEDGKDISRILVSTSGSEIYEIATKMESLSLVSEGHHVGEIWGLATSPIDPDLFITCGDDKTLRLWSISERRVICKAVLDCTSRAIDWSADGKRIVIGMGGNIHGKKLRKDGAFLVLDGDTLKPIFEGRDSRSWICCVRISPDGHHLIVASCVGYLYIYETSEYRLIDTLSTSIDESSPSSAASLDKPMVSAMDFSHDSRYLRCDICEQGKFETIVVDVHEGKVVERSLFSVDLAVDYQETDLANFDRGQSKLMSDIKWSEPTCVRDISTTGGLWMYPSSHVFGEPCCAHVASNGDLITVGDNYGDIRVYEYPCTIPIPPAKSNKSKSLDTIFDPHTVRPLTYIPRGHSGSISQIRFSSDNQYIISIGKSDRAVMIWRIHKKP